NLLKQAGVDAEQRIERNLLEEAAESDLVAAIDATEGALERALEQKDYPAALTALAGLREPVDGFFDQVMVMCDDEALKNNRLAVLAHLRSMFLRVADV